MELEPIAKATESNGSFSKINPGLQLVWDSVSLGAMKVCPRYYQYSVIYGFQPRNRSVDLTFGLYLHSALEKFDHAKAEGADFEEAQQIMVRNILEITTHDVTITTCASCGATAHEHEAHPELCPVCGGDTFTTETKRVPWETDHPNKNRFTLLRTCVWYTEHYKDDPAKTLILANGKPAVELSFKMDLPTSSEQGEAYMLSGHMDRVVEFIGNIYVMDRKTTKNTIGHNFFAGFSPDNQMTLYTTASQVIFDLPAKGVIIDGCQVGVNFSRFQRGFAMRTPSELNEWLADAISWIARAEQYAKAEYWPMNDKSCHHYRGCDFRGVCSKSPEVRVQFLKGDFIRRIWDPTVNR